MRNTYRARAFASIAVIAITIFSFPSLLWAQSDSTVVIDGTAPATPLPHFWEHIFGSGRAILSLRDSYRQDLREVKGITGMQYVRFHAIFHDEVGVYD